MQIMHCLRLGPDDNSHNRQGKDCPGAVKTIATNTIDMTMWGSRLADMVAVPTSISSTMFWSFPKHKGPTLPHWSVLKTSTRLISETLKHCETLHRPYGCYGHGVETWPRITVSRPWELHIGFSKGKICWHDTRYTSSVAPTWEDFHTPPRAFVFYWFVMSHPSISTIGISLNASGTSD